MFFEQPSLNAFANYSIGLSLGARDFLVENVKCIFYVLEHPLAAIQEMARAVIHLDQTYRAVRDYIVETIALHSQMPIAEKGRLHLRLLGDVLWTVGLFTVPSISMARINSMSIFVERSGAKVKAIAQTVSERASRVLPKIDLQRPIGYAEWFAYDQP